MKFNGKTIVALTLLLTSVWCSAQTEKPLTIVVPTAAGGGNDAMARTIGQKLGVLLNRTVIVENKAGANGSLASEFVAKAAPDGNTLMFGYIATHAMNPALQKLRYDPVKDFEPVGLVGYSPTLMVVNTGVKVKDVKDLVRLLKENPMTLVLLQLAMALHRTLPPNCSKCRRKLQCFTCHTKDLRQPSTTPLAVKLRSCFPVCSQACPL